MLRKSIKFCAEICVRQSRLLMINKRDGLSELDDELIKQAIKSEPILASFHEESWKMAYTAFVNQGYNHTNFLRIVVDYPQILGRHPNKICSSLETWRKCQFGEKLLQLLICKYPYLLDVSEEKELLLQVNHLKFLAKSQKNIWKLFMNCPNLVTDKPFIVDKKIDYLLNIMRLNYLEIVNSAVLCKPLNDIKSRHIFLERLGLFKPRSLKADPLEPTKNPKLSHIMDTPEKKFATKIAHVCLDEYEAFKDLLHLEDSIDRHTGNFNERQESE